MKRLGIVKHVLPIHNIQIRCISYLRSWQKKRLFCWIIQKIRAIGRGGALCGVKWEALQVSRSIVSLNFTCFVSILRSVVSVVFFPVVVVYDSRASLNYFGTVEPNLSIMHGCAAYNLLKINSFIIFCVAHFCVCVCVCLWGKFDTRSFRLLYAVVQSENIRTRTQLFDTMPYDDDAWHCWHTGRKLVFLRNKERKNEERKINKI